MKQFMILLALALSINTNAQTPTPDTEQTGEQKTSEFYYNNDEERKAERKACKLKVLETPVSELREKHIDDTFCAMIEKAHVAKRRKSLAYLKQAGRSDWNSRLQILQSLRRTQETIEEIKQSGIPVPDVQEFKRFEEMKNGDF